MFRLKGLISLLFFLAFSVNMGGKTFTLVIDAGHGGHDAGAVGAFSKEKDINLNVALAFGRYVERNCPDVKVIYTRTTDVFVTLDGRATIANKAYQLSAQWSNLQRNGDIYPGNAQGC